MLKFYSKFSKKIMNISIYKISGIILKIIVWILAFLLIILRWLDIYINIQSNDKNILQQLQTINKNSSLKYYKNASSYIIRYAELWDISNPTLIFIHGTPWSLSDVFPLLEKTDILTRYHVIIPDRPGFGGSMKGNEMPTIKEQWDRKSVV